MTTPKKPLSLKRYSEPDLVAALVQADEDLRAEAFREIAARGEKHGWEAFGLLTRDPALAGMFLSLKDPFDAVGILVGPETYRKIREVWPAGVERAAENGRPELTIDFRNQRLDVMILPDGAWPAGEKSTGREGISEVEFRVKDVAVFAARVEALEGDLRSRLSLLPKNPMKPSAGRWLLAHIRAARGARTILVQLLPPAL